MRKHDLDHLRIIMILLLFPVHTFMIWNDYGTKFYVWGGESRVLSSLIVLVNPWFMAILFVIAGMCANYASEKRNTKEFIKERVARLLIPFLCGQVLLVPLQAYYARKFFFGYEGSIAEHYLHFFTHVTDLSGYDGNFTPGHLWFILFLFIISLAALCVIKGLPLEKVSPKLEKLNIIGVVALFIPVWLLYYIGNFGSFSLGKYFALYLLGYYVLSNETVMDKLIRNRKWILGLFGLSQLLLVVVYFYFAYYGDLLVNFVGWLGVLSCLIIGKQYLSKKRRMTDALKKASFPIYILHQTALVVIGYYALTKLHSMALQIVTILFGSFLATIMLYELIRRIPVLKKSIGVR